MSWGVAAVGLLLTALLLQYLISSASRTRIIELSVTQRTGELVQSNQALGAEIQERKRAEQDRVALERELAPRSKRWKSLGTLAGGIAHEINSPVQYVGENLGFLRDSVAGLSQVLSKYRILAETPNRKGVLRDEVAEVAATIEATNLEFLRQEMPASIDQSLEGIERISEIVRAIREFSHPGAKEKTAIDINRAIATTLTVANNQTKYVADVETDFDTSLPPVACLPGEFNQAILNLLVNAAHAIEETASERRAGSRWPRAVWGIKLRYGLAIPGSAFPMRSGRRYSTPSSQPKSRARAPGRAWRSAIPSSPRNTAGR